MPQQNSLSTYALYIAVFAGIVLANLAPVRSAAQQGIAVNANVEDGSFVITKRTQPATQSGMNAVPEGFAELRLSPGFLLQMDIYGIPEMSTQLRVDTQGNVELPLVGAVHVEGSTVLEAQDAIAKALDEQEILKNSQVMLNILQYSARNISVMGEVQSPGRIQLLAPRPLADVLALAGGETLAAGDDIELQHYGETGETVVRHVQYEPGKDRTILQSVFVEPGDTVIVHRAGVIYVLGAVNRPGGYLMLNGGKLNVVQAISLAGGETLQSSAAWAVIVRRRGNTFDQIKAPLKKMEKGDTAPVALEVNDALYVPTSGWKSIVLNGSSVLSAAAAASIYAVASAP